MNRWPRRTSGRRKLGLDRLELLERGAQVFGDLGSNQIGVGQVGGVFERLVLEPEDVEADLVALEQLVITVGAPAAVRALVQLNK